MKDELGGKILTKFVELRGKTCGYLRDDGGEYHKAKIIKECVNKKLKFENYKSCLEAIQLKNKLNYLEKIEINLGSLKKDH